MDKDNKTEMIPIPEGLEERLTAKIDGWARQERIRRRSAAAAVAIFVALAAGITFRIGSAPAPTVQESISDPVLACQEAGKALEQLVENLERGLSAIEKSGSYE